VSVRASPGVGMQYKARALQDSRRKDPQGGGFFDLMDSVLVTWRFRWPVWWP
jgi:hypothetical protein